MFSEQRKAIVNICGTLVVVAVGVWVLWGSQWWSDRSQNAVLADLTEVAERDAASVEPTDDDAASASTTTLIEDDAADESTTGPPATASTSTDVTTSTTSSADTGSTNPSSADTSSTTEAPSPPPETTTEPPVTETTTTETTTTETTTTEATTTTETTEAEPPQAPTVASFEVVETIPHDTSAFTQGLEIANGRLFESTGLVGESSIRELDIESGAIIRNTSVDNVFAEGLTIVDDTAIQLTWQAGIAYRYDLDTFALLDAYNYDGQGWGLCLASGGSGNLVMSDGSSTLEFRDPDTFEPRGSVDVRFDGNPIERLNELECVGNTVWANIWLSSLVIEIDPNTGSVLTVLDIDSLRPESTDDDSNAVWNGLAWDPTDGTLLVTGKRWPTIYRLELS